MADLDLVLEELVTANRILAHEGVVDGFGHVTVRHPQRPDRYLMSRARAPDCVEVADHGGMILVRDTKRHDDGPVHGFTAAEWRTFIAGIRAAE